MEAHSSRADRVDAYQRRHSWIGFPLAVVYKLADDRGVYLAALVTYYAFVSLFPLLLMFVSVLGFVLQSDPGLRAEIVSSTIGGIPGLGPVLRSNVTGLKGSGIGVAVGFAGLVYGGLGATQAAQTAFNTIYAVPRNRQPNPLVSRRRSLEMLAVLGVMVLLSSAINLVIPNDSDITARLNPGLRLVGYLVGLVVSVGLFSTAFRSLTACRLRWRDVAVGGALSGVAWELLQAFGSRLVVHEVDHGQSLYGVFGVVLVTIAVIYLVALVVMISAEVNVIRGRHLWPRSLLAPFSDQIQPTPADLEVYRGYAKAQTFKGWEKVGVEFDPPGPVTPPGSVGATGPVGAPGPVGGSGPVGAPGSVGGSGSAPSFGPAPGGERPGEGVAPPV